MCLLEVLIFDLIFDLHYLGHNSFIYFNIADIWHTFQVGICPEKFQLDQIQNGGITKCAVSARYMP